MNYTIYLGWDNLLSTISNIPIGPQNEFSPINEDQEQPTSYDPGRTTYYPANPLNITLYSSTIVTWTLGNAVLTINVNDTSSLCPIAITFEIVITANESLSQQDIQNLEQSIASYLNISVDRVVIQQIQSKKKRDVEFHFSVTVLPTNSSNSNEISSFIAVNTILNAPASTLNNIITSSTSISVSNITVNAVNPGVGQVGVIINPPTSIPQNIPIINVPEGVPTTKSNINSSKKLKMINNIIIIGFFLIFIL